MDLPLIPSAAEKKAKAAQQAMQEQFDAELEIVNSEKDAAIQRAEMAEQRADNAEYKLDEESRNFSEQLAAHNEAAKQREAQLVEAARKQDEAAKQAAHAAAEIRAALEADKSSLSTRLEEAQARIPILEEQYKQMESHRDAEAEKVGELAQKLAQTLAEKKGHMELHDQAKAGWEQSKATHEQSSHAAIAKLQEQLDTARTQLASTEQAREASVAEAAGLATQLAQAKTEGAALTERLANLEQRRVDEVREITMRGEAVSAAHDEMQRLREISLSELRDAHLQITQLSTEKSALAALVPKLEKRLEEEQAAERARSDGHIARAEQHTVEARAQRDASDAIIVKLREELSAAAAAATSREQLLTERLQAVQVELATWPPRMEIAEGRMETTEAKLATALGGQHTARVELATLSAEKRSLEELVRRTEAWGEQQAHELRESVASGIARLEAAAAERVSLIEQKEAAADGWRRRRRLGGEPSGEAGGGRGEGAIGAAA